MEKLDEMLEHRKLQMKEHHAGRQLLNDEVSTPGWQWRLQIDKIRVYGIQSDPFHSQDHARVTRQLVNFERKLHQLKSMPEEDKAEMYDTDAESIYKMNSVEYLDFNA